MGAGHRRRSYRRNDDCLLSCLPPFQRIMGGASKTMGLAFKCAGIAFLLDCRGRLFLNLVIDAELTIPARTAIVPVTRPSKEFNS